MTVRYGNPNCKHEWRLRIEGWEDECGPAVCIKCGAFGCLCDVPRDIPYEQFRAEGQKGDANTNGKWINPYIQGV